MAPDRVPAEALSVQLEAQRRPEFLFGRTSAISSLGQPASIPSQAGCMEREQNAPIPSFVILSTKAELWTLPRAGWAALICHELWRRQKEEVHFVSTSCTLLAVEQIIDLRDPTHGVIRHLPHKAVAVVMLGAQVAVIERRLIEPAIAQVMAQGLTTDMIGRVRGVTGRTHPRPRRLTQPIGRMERQRNALYLLAALTCHPRVRPTAETRFILPYTPQ